MSDATPSPFGPNDEPDLQTSFVLGEQGWETTEYVEPGPDWRVADDGSYESPDGRIRSWSAAEPVEWTDVAGGSEG